MYDLIIANGLVVDGSGAAPTKSDVAVLDGKIAAVGSALGEARDHIDATGLVVTPGFIDVHTHFDGQAIWDSTLAPAVWHGVSTAILGNCGVGFAPARPESHAYLIDLMASVEDIPAESLEAGLDWSWESFPEYLDAVGRRPHTMNIAAMITHGSLRRYVMGERANDEPSAEEIAAMAALVREAMRAGAVGLSTSRTELHAASDGSPLPGTFATEEELTALARAVREGSEGRRGVLEVSPAGITVAETRSLDEEVELLIRVARASGCPVIFLLVQSNFEPRAYRTVLARCAEAQRDGVPIHVQVSSRPVAAMMGFQGNYHPFAGLPSYAPLRDLTVAERVAALQDPAMRARLLTEVNANPTGIDAVFVAPDFWSQVFVMGNPLNYYPDSKDSIQARADALGVNPREIAYDAMLADEGRGFLIYAIVNWHDRNVEAIHTMLTHSATIIGLGDAGAHVTALTDASGPTTVLTDFVRDRAEGDRYRIPLEQAVKMLTWDNAQMFGMLDRGAIRPGLRADLNLIDLSALATRTPMIVNDLPLDRPRLDQKASGYVATLVGGEVVQRNGELTGALPGKVERLKA